MVRRFGSIRSPDNDGYGESEMHKRLTALGYPFERQHREGRFRIDLALPDHHPPFALEIERHLMMPHYVGVDGVPFWSRWDGDKYPRLLHLLGQGWHVMTMRPPYWTSWDEAVIIVMEYLDQIEQGNGPRYVSFTQKSGADATWYRTEGDYYVGRLKIRGERRKPQHAKMVSLPEREPVLDADFQRLIWRLRELAGPPLHEGYDAVVAWFMEGHEIKARAWASGVDLE